MGYVNSFILGAPEKSEVPWKSLTLRSTFNDTVKYLYPRRWSGTGAEKAGREKEIAIYFKARSNDDYVFRKYLRRTEFHDYPVDDRNNRSLLVQLAFRSAISASPFSPFPSFNRRFVRSSPRFPCSRNVISIYGNLRLISLSI